MEPKYVCGLDTKAEGYTRDLAPFALTLSPAESHGAARAVITNNISTHNHKQPQHYR